MTFYEKLAIFEKECYFKKLCNKTDWGDKMSKISVNNICGVSIIYSAEDPSRIFLETKTSDYPVKVFAGTLCLIGGNWVGEAAKADVNPMATLQREIDEELCLVPLTEEQHEELSLLGLGQGTKYDLQKNTNASETDIKSLAEVKKAITLSVVPFVDAISLIPKCVFDSSDTQNKRGDIQALLSNYLVPLEKDVWNELVRLQKTYGNLSNESLSVLLTFDEIRHKKLRVSWGHDRALDLFCRTYVDDKGIPLVEGIVWQNHGRPMRSYAEYEELYDVAKRP